MIGRRRRRISRELRRRRLGRAVVGALLGLVWSTGLVAALSQLGRVDQSGLPWWGGIGLGVGLSVSLTLVRCSLRRLRVTMVRSQAAYVVPLLAGAVGAALWLAAGARPAAAQGTPESIGGSCAVDAILTFADGRTATTRLSATTRHAPLVIDPDTVVGVEVELTGDRGISLDGRTLEVWTEIAGFDHRLSQIEIDNGKRRYRFDDVGALVAVPGLFHVWGRLEGVCRSDEAWIRIAGSPLSTWSGRMALLAVAGGGGGLTAFLVRTRFDYWSFTTADGVTLSLLDEHSGRLVRGPLVRGATYTAEVALSLPDPPYYYDALPGPVHAVIGLIGAGVVPQAATFDLRTRRPRVRRPVEIPADVDATVHLVADVHVAGNAVQSLSLVQDPHGLPTGLGRSVPRGLGTLAYRSASFGAAQLIDLAPVDAMVTIHGDAAGRVLETWTLLPSHRLLNRHLVRTDELVLAASRYRDQLNRQLGDWAGAAAGGPYLAALALVGAELRRTVVGDPLAVAPLDGRVAVAHDPEVLGAMTFPWAGLYDGLVTDDGSSSICTTYHDDPAGCAHHGDSVVCPGRFWGVRYELAWPDGWVPQTAVRGRLARWWHLLTERLGWGATARLPNRLVNRQPVEILSVTAPELDDHRLENRDGLRDVARTHPAATVAQLETQLARVGSKVDIVHVLAHGIREAPIGHGSLTASGYSFQLDQPVGGRRLADLADRGTLRQGPIVVLNACWSGVVGLDDSHRLIDAFRRLGARAVVVTEAEIDADTASAFAAELVGELLTGATVPAALLDIRRRELACDRRLTSLVYTYYGPARLRLVHPVSTTNPWRRACSSLSST